MALSRVEPERGRPEIKWTRDFIGHSIALEISNGNPCRIQGNLNRKMRVVVVIP